MTSGARTSTTTQSASSELGSSPVPIPVASRNGRSAPSSRSRRQVPVIAASGPPVSTTLRPANSGRSSSFSVGTQAPPAMAAGVLLGVDQDVDQGRAGGGEGPADGRLDLGGVLDPEAEGAVGAGPAGEVGRAAGGAVVAGAEAAAQ